MCRVVISGINLCQSNTLFQISKADNKTETLLFENCIIIFKNI